MRFGALPSECPVDRSLQIRLEGATAGERVGLRLVSRYGDGVLGAEALFTAQADGTVDLTRDAPVSGTYAGVDPMGLFWSRTVLPAEQGAAVTEVDADPLTATLIAEPADGRARVLHRIRRRFAGADVSERDVRDHGLVGKLFERETQGPCPGVLVVGGSEGGTYWSYRVAALLASHGFRTLALAYFNLEGLPPALDQIPLEYFDVAIRWLGSSPGVKADKLGVVGSSRGGELALLLGATNPSLRAVVAYAPSGIVWSGLPAVERSAWSRGGKPVPFATPDEDPRWKDLVAAGEVDEDGFDWYDFALRYPARVKAASIPVERTQGPVLMITGADDRLWPASRLTGYALERLRRHRFAHRVEHLCYPDAGHAFCWPHQAAALTLRIVHPVGGKSYDLGGTAAGNAKAASDSWPRMIDFLHEALA